MYENPRSCILKRNDLLLAHSRYLTKKSLADRKASEEFVSATTQLVTELPPFLSQVSRYFNIIVEAFADTQAIYHLAVSERWNQFAEQWCNQIPGGPYDAVEAEFAARHQPLESMMETLRRGLDLPSSSEPLPFPPISLEHCSLICFKRREHVAQEHSRLSCPLASRPTLHVVASHGTPPPPQYRIVPKLEDVNAFHGLPTK